MMRKLLGILIVLLFYCLIVLSVAPKVFAANKVGVNIAARHKEFEQAANLVGPGGFIVIMASPGNADEILPLLNSHPDKNIILRGHCPSDPLGPDAEKNKNLALSWIATLGGLETAGRKIYFMPWNEPNMTRECGGAGNDFDANDTTCAPFVAQYITDLKQALGDGGAGNVSGKILLLSPMINQHHANFDAFISTLGRSFFDQFEGISMNLYDNETCGGPLCHPEAHRNAGKFEEILNKMSSSKGAFAVETGIVDVSGTCSPGVTDCPVYEDLQMRSFIEAAWTKSWAASGRLKMFSPLSYNPEINPPSWIWGSESASYMQSIRGGGSVTSVSGFNKDAFLAWREAQLSAGNLIKCPGGESAFAVSEEYCGFCAAGKYVGEGEVVEYTETRSDTHTEGRDWQGELTPTPGGPITSSIGALGVIGPNKEVSLKISMKDTQAKFPFLKNYQERLAQALDSVLPGSIRRVPQANQFKRQTFASVCDRSDEKVKVDTKGKIDSQLSTDYTNYLYETGLGAALVPGRNETADKQLVPPKEISEEEGNAPVDNCDVEVGKETETEEENAPGEITVQSKGLLERVGEWFQEFCLKLGICSGSWSATVVLRNFTPGLDRLFNNTISDEEGFWNAYRPHQVPKFQKLASSNPDEVIFESSPGDVVPKNMQDKYLAGALEAQYETTCGSLPYVIQDNCPEYFAGLQPGQEPVIDPVTGDIDMTPPNSDLLKDLFKEASITWSVPEGVIAAVAKIEGGHMWRYSKSEIEDYSKPSGKDPINCRPNVCSAAGPMQITTGADGNGNPTCPGCPPAKGTCPNQWATYGDSVLRVGSRAPDVCNIKDALHAAAHKMKNDSGGGSWDKDTVYRVAERYYGKCDDEHRYARLGNRTYCEFVWEYYQNYK